MTKIVVTEDRNILYNKSVAHITTTACSQKMQPHQKIVWCKQKSRGFESMITYGGESHTILRNVDFGRSHDRCLLL